MASTNAVGVPSLRDLRTAASAALDTVSMSRRQPRSITLLQPFNGPPTLLLAPRLRPR